MSDESLFDRTSGMRQLETEINHIFDHHKSALHKKKWTITDQMTEWSNTLIRQIQEHVTEQRKLLDQVYNNKINYLNTICDQVIKQILTFEEKQEIEQINQLLNQCNTLKVELAELMYVQRPISSIKLITEEPLIQQNPDEYNQHKTEDEQSQKKVMEEHSNNVINSIDVDESSPPSPSHIEPTNSPPLSVAKPTIDEDQSISNSYRSEDNVSTRDELANKCPICFMIFPQMMTTHDRNIHVNEHYQDD